MQKRSAYDAGLLAVTLLLLALGLIMVYSSTGVPDGNVQNGIFGQAFYFLRKQGIQAALALLAMYIFSRVDYHWWRTLALPIIGLAVVLLIMVLIPGVGKKVGGAYRWLLLGSFTFAPAEGAKLALIIYLAASLSRGKNFLLSFGRGLLPNLIVIAIIAGLVLLQPDLGTSVIICATAYILLWVGEVKGRYLVALAGAGIAAVAAAIILAPYRWSRLMTFLHPWDDPLGAGYQTIQSLYALGSGGLTGVGLGKSGQKYFYLPEQHTDFIFAILGEELGWLGALLVLLLFLLFIWRGAKIASQAHDDFGAYLAVGITSIISLQAFINMAMVAGALPVTGVPLPFISYGGSSLLITLMATGILLNVSAYIPRREPRKNK